jgi:hypothetical protein
MGENSPNLVTLARTQTSSTATKNVSIAESHNAVAKIIIVCFIAKHIFLRLPAYLLPGLPDGLFSNQKFQFGKILEGFGKENVSTFMPICNILWPSGIFYGHLAIQW